MTQSETTAVGRRTSPGFVKPNVWALLLAGFGVSAMSGCGSSGNSDASADSGGGRAAAGTGAGGSSATLGGASTAGGSVATGGAASSSGGNASGGLPSSSGGNAAGGTAAGGASAGGTAATGGGGTAGMGGTGVAGSAGKPPGTPAANAATVDPSKEYQTMDGFGIADVWQGKGASTPTLLTLLFDPDKGIGLSLLRIGIETTGKIMGDAAFVDGPEVVKHGGKVWAAPWSPPAASKDNNNVNNGGHLKTASYDSWASVLASFPAYYKQQSGVDLYAISPQNEPDFVASYESCIYDKTQMNNFIKVLAPKLSALTPPVHVLAAEPDVWNNLWSGDNYGTAILGDPSVSSLVTIIATHDYGSNVASTTRPAPPAGNTHHVWQTEITCTSGASIGPGLDIARGIYAGIVGGGVSGWHYWWTQAFMDGGNASNPPKRVYAMGNFSKFVRPGYIRVGVTGQPTSLQVATFKNPADNTVVIVVLNGATSPVTLPVFVAGSSWPASVTPYVTDAAHNLAAQAPIAVTSANFSATVGAQSVTTFVGEP